MRLVLDIKLKKQELPRDYRSGFMSLIKTSIEAGDDKFFKSLYEQKKDKPFTFSVYFPRLKGEENGRLIVGDKAILNFSSNSPAYITHFYNGARKIKAHQWQNENVFAIENIKILFSKEISQSHCIFKTVSPFLVNKQGDNLRFLTPEDPDFDKSFRFGIHELCKQFLEVDTFDFDYKITMHKKMVVSHYNQSMTCNKGIIEMWSRPDVLNLLYHIGIGVRRSQGFGMIDLV